MQSMSSSGVHSAEMVMKKYSAGKWDRGLTLCYLITPTKTSFPWRHSFVHCRRFLGGPCAFIGNHSWRAGVRLSKAMCQSAPIDGPHSLIKRAYPRGKARQGQGSVVNPSTGPSQGCIFRKIIRGIKRAEVNRNWNLFLKFNYLI